VGVGPGMGLPNQTGQEERHKGGQGPRPARTRYAEPKN
jgi:hypothetical protein